MYALPKGLYMKYNENTLESVRKSFDLDKPGAMANAVDALEEWVKKQDHFTKTDFDKSYLEATIIVSKGSIERAKTRIDRSCTLRTLMPNVFRVHDIRYLLRNKMKGIECAVLPKMTKDNTRVTILRVKNTCFDVLGSCSVGSYLCEYLRRYDYAESNCLVIDFEKMELVELVKKLATNLTLVQQTVAYMLACCGFRLKGVYLINSSSKFLKALVETYKQITSPKIRDRLHTLKDKPCLKEVFDTEILPKEYGGTEKTLLELQEDLLDELTSEEHTQYMKEMSSARTDEARRQSAKFNEEYLGMPGSFRELHVD